ncbi:MAG: MFS transporter [Promethearchaeota archaeon]
MKNNKIIEQEIIHSKKIMCSYSMGQFFGQWINNTFGMFVFFYYETEIGLNVGLAALAFILYSIWNAINDPLTGFLMEKFEMPWERKWGKHFPWVIIGAIPWAFSFALIFMIPPNLNPTEDQGFIFLWMLISICLYDTLLTLWDLAYYSMYPDKFRQLDERRTFAAIITFIGMSGLVASSVIPPLFIKFGDPLSYRMMAWAITGIGLVFFLFSIPGIREDKITIIRYRQRREQEKLEVKKSFIQTAKMVITDKRFMSKVIFFFGYQTAALMLQASAPYMVNFVIRMEASSITIFMGVMLLGAFLSIPIWMKLAKIKNDNRKMSLYAGWVMFFTFLPIFFANNFIFFLISMILFGTGLAGQWIIDPPTISDVFDDIAVRTGKRQEAVYFGYNAFFLKFGGIVQAAIFASVHILTGFPEGVSSFSELITMSPTPELALLGIRLHSSIIPALIVLIANLVFLKFYDITPELVAKNKEQLKEIGL